MRYNYILVLIFHKTRATDLTCDSARLSSAFTTHTFDNQQRYKRDEHEREDYSSDDAKIYARIHSTVPATILIEPGTTAHLVLAAVFEPRPCPTSLSSVHFECLS